MTWTERGCYGVSYTCDVTSHKDTTHNDTIYQRPDRGEYKIVALITQIYPKMAKMHFV